MTADRYDTPEEGATDWHLPLNESFEQFDVDVEVRDVEAHRDQYPAEQGAKFLATDTGEVFLGDGSSWTSIGRLAQRRIFVQADEPTEATTGDLWIRPK